MKLKYPNIILDSSCVLGTHRITKIISEPFEKLILPKDIEILGWPQDIELIEFYFMKEYNDGNIKNAFKNSTSLKSKFSDIIKIERDKSYELLNKLKEIGRLKILDFEQWPFDYEINKENNFTGFHNKITLEYISMPIDKQKKFRLGVADIRAVAGTIYNGEILKSYHPYINSFLLPLAQKEFVLCQEKLLPSKLNPKDIEEFIELSAKGKINEHELIKKYKEINSVLIHEKVLFMLCKGLAELIFPVIGPLNSIYEIGKLITEEQRKKNKQDILSSIIKTHIDSIDNENVRVIEDMIRFFMEKPIVDKWENGYKK